MAAGLPRQPENGGAFRLLRSNDLVWSVSVHQYLLGHRGRHYYTARRRRGDCYIDPERWLEHASEHEGSWWPAWTHWLDAVSTQQRVPPRTVEAELGPAPGSYVLQR
nr:hypothetical protein [Massilia frigida]